MNRALRLESILRAHDNRTTLGQIIKSAEMREDFSLRHRLTNAMSELRADLESRTPMETLVWTKGWTPGEGVYAIVPAEVRDGVVVVKATSQIKIEEPKMTREQLLREFPIKNNEDGDTWPEFKDLMRIVKSQKLGPQDIDFIFREIVSRRVSKGLVAGRNKRVMDKKTGVSSYVSA